MDQNFNVVFSGKILDGVNLGEAKQNFCKLFKINERIAGKIFSSDKVRIRKNLSHSKAMLVLNKLNGIGMVCYIEPFDETKDAGNYIIREKFPLDILMRFIACFFERHSWVKKVIDKFLLLASVAMMFYGLFVIFLDRALGKPFVELFWSLYFIFQLFLISRTKSLNFKEVYIFFLAGALISAVLTSWTGSLLSQTMGLPSRDFYFVAVWTPISEEFFKILPLLGFFCISFRGRHLGVMDCGLAAFATGTGFAFAEDSFRRIYFSIEGSEYPLKASLSTFLDVAHENSFAYFCGHAVATSLVGITFGIAARYRRKAALLWVVPFIAFFWITLDHSALNMSFQSTHVSHWVVQLHQDLGRGSLSVPLLIFFSFLGFFIDFIDYKKNNEKSPRGVGFISILRKLDWRLLFSWIYYTRNKKIVAYVRSRIKPRKISPDDYLISYQRKYEKLLTFDYSVVGGVFLLGFGGMTLFSITYFFEPMYSCLGCVLEAVGNHFDEMPTWKKIGVFSLGIGVGILMGLAVGIPASIATGGALSVAGLTYNVFEYSDNVGRFVQNPQKEVSNMWKDVKTNPFGTAINVGSIALPGMLAKGIKPLTKFIGGLKGYVKKIFSSKAMKGVDSEIDDAIEGVFRRGEVRSGEPIELLGHKTAPKARKIGGLSGKDIQSAHGAPQSVMREVASYDPNAALTRLMPTEVHRAMDSGWQKTARMLRSQGETSWTAQEMYEAVSESIRRTPGLSDGEKFSHIGRLSDEIFVEFGLKPTDLVRLPGK